MFGNYWLIITITKYRDCITYLQSPGTLQLPPDWQGHAIYYQCLFNLKMGPEMLVLACYSHASMVTPTTCSRRNNVFSPSKTLKQVFLAEKSIFDLPLGYKLVDRHSAWPQIVFSIYIFYSMLEMNNFRGPLRHIMLSVIRRRKNMDIGTLTCTLRNCCVIYLRCKEYEKKLKVL